MALWVCRECTTAYAVGLPACPHCGSTVYRPDWEEDVAKIVAGVGPSNALAAPGETGYVPEPGEGGGAQVDEQAPAVLPDPPPVRAPKAEWVEHAVEVVGLPPGEAESMTKPELVETVKGLHEEGDQTSAGTSSSTSSSSEPKSSPGTPTGLPPPALGAGNPSETPPPASPAAEPSFTAGSMAGSTPATGSARNPSNLTNLLGGGDGV